ncbi:MAG: phytanoyl-CoA dioxygenase family protein [Acidimicrobiaceae bacterium]|nr:phytanoyl-CoA dioxygenase family protein [Acidimicrobiaceae bacterium]
MTEVTSNGVAVPFDDRHAAPLTESSDLLADPVALRRRYAEDGYLYLRGVLDPALVLETRAAYFSRFDPGYLAEGTAVGDGVFSGRRPPELGAHGTVGHPAHGFVRSPEWRRLVEQPALASVASLILDGPCICLPRQIVRQFDRSSGRASRAHVDHTYLDQGRGDVTTLWIPLGDCPLETGPLVYLEGSHRLGADDLEGLRQVTDRPDDRRPLSHDLGWVSEQVGARWRWADFRAGDVAVHSPHIVHASLDVQSDRMRLSADIRFIRDDAEADPRWLVPWAGDDGY